MKRKTLWEIGGFVAGGVLILFGLILALAVFGRREAPTEGAVAPAG
jgi:hypothetical protein